MDQPQNDMQNMSQEMPQKGKKSSNKTLWIVIGVIVVILLLWWIL